VRRRVVGWFSTTAPRLLPAIVIDNEEGIYGMPAPQGRYKIGLHAVGGATSPDDVAEPDAHDAATLSAQVRELLPKHDPKPVKMAACLYTVTPDENFLIAPSSVHERVLIFSACSGHGFKYAPVFGELAEEWLKGEPSEELAAFSLHGRAGAATGLGAHRF
jgi:sarcosine oxidase